MKKIHFLVAVGVMATVAGGCRKKPDPVSIPITSSVTLQFEHIVGDMPLVLDSAIYTNANGDSFTVSKYRYYISNIKLLTAEGKEFAEPESYHLVKEDDVKSKTFSIDSVPAGQYTKISFLIGVDSLRNVSGAQTGALDPSHGMFWDWETGYIMALFEGKRLSTDEPLAMHISSYRKPYNALRWVTLPLPSSAVVSQGKVPNIHIISDVAEWFKTPNTINFAELQVTGGGPDALKLADNYADMFKVEHVD